ncbi:MAG: hypothetical protein U0840_10870 [Gemmataceae bacterium]
MRQILGLVVSVLEVACGITLGVLAFLLPGSGDVAETAGRLEAASQSASRQVGALAEQCRALREQQPGLRGLAVRLEKQVGQVSQQLHGRTLDGAGLQAACEALDLAAEGLEGVSATLDPRGVEQLARGLGSAASYLDEKVLPTASKAADTLDRAAAQIKPDAARLARILEEKPLDLKGARALVESLEKFEDGLDRLGRTLLPENFEQMRNGVKGLEVALDAGSGQVEKMGKYTMPKVAFKDLRLAVEEKPFWPDAKTVAEGMSKAAKGAQAAVKEMDGIHRELPRFRESLGASQKVVASMRKHLQELLQRQELLEPLLRRLTGQLARLGDDLPTQVQQLAAALRDTGKLREVATALRQAEKGLGTVATRWPELRTGLSKSVALLRTTRKQLQQALGVREQFETALDETLRLSRLFAESLPVVVEQVETGLERQEASLGELRENIDHVQEAIPAGARTISRILTTTRLLLGLVGVFVVLHGVQAALRRRRPIDL